MAKAEVYYGRSFDNWGQFYAWLLAIDRNRLLDWEYQRIDLWNQMVRKSTVAEGGLDVAGLKRNAERALEIFGVDTNPIRDSAFDFPRGGEIQTRVAHQMHDPDSPLNRGDEDWEQYDMAP